MPLCAKTTLHARSLLVSSAAWGGQTVEPREPRASDGRTGTTRLLFPSTYRDPGRRHSSVIIIPRSLRTAARRRRRRGGGSGGGGAFFIVAARHSPGLGTLISSCARACRSGLSCTPVCSGFRWAIQATWPLPPLNPLQPSPAAATICLIEGIISPV